MLSTIETYNPNTDEIKLINLNTYHESLVNSTKNVDTTVAELNTKFIERNNLLYAERTGLYTIAQNVKKRQKFIWSNLTRIFYNQ